MDKKQQQEFITTACEELEIPPEHLAKMMRVTEPFLTQLMEGQRIMEHDVIKRLEVIIMEHRFNKLAVLDLQNEMELFCHQARITEGQLVQLMGLSSVNQLYEIYRKKPLSHVLHFILLRRELKLSQKSGKRFRMHMDMVHYELLPVTK